MCVDFVKGNPKAIFWEDLNPTMLVVEKFHILSLVSTYIHDFFIRTS